MTESQRYTIRASEIRSRLNEINAIDGDAYTDEIRAESDRLTVEYRDVETKLRAAVVAEGPTDDRTTPTDGAADPETRERLNLRGKLSLGGWLAAQLGEKSGIDLGALAEYRAACKVDRPGLPIDLFEQDRPLSSPETCAVTGAPATGTGVTVAPVQPFIFAESIAARLGIDMPTAPTGAYSEMTISTALQPTPEAKGDPADGTAAALTATTAGPRRVSARLSLSLEDIAAVGQANFESALRSHVSMALSDAVDNQVINGNGTAPNINGLINQLTDPANPTAVAAFDDFVAAFADQIDGLWAAMVSQVSIVANVDAYKLAAKTFRDRIIDTGQRGGVSLGDESVASYLARVTGGWWTNKRMPATASTIARGIVYRMGRMGIRTACLPTWGTIAIDDIYTDSAKGERHFTVHTLIGDKVLIVQPDAYDLAEFKVS